jgi:hypothetical protein
MRQWQRAEPSTWEPAILVAVNFNLNTTSVRRAMAIAFDVREKGRKKREAEALPGRC